MPQLPASAIRRELSFHRVAAALQARRPGLLESRLRSGLLLGRRLLLLLRRRGVLPPALPPAGNRAGGCSSACIADDPAATAPRAAPRAPAPGVVPVAVVGGWAACCGGGGLPDRSRSAARPTCSTPLVLLLLLRILSLGRVNVLLSKGHRHGDPDDHRDRNRSSVTGLHFDPVSVREITTSMIASVRRTCKHFLPLRSGYHRPGELLIRSRRRPRSMRG